MHIFKLRPDTVETTPITGVKGHDKPLTVVTQDRPLLEITDEQLPQFEDSGIYHLFDRIEPDDAADEPSKEELQARYKELSGEDADKRWSVKKLAEVIAELEAATGDVNTGEGE